jgi:hypothetical protein
MVFLPVPEMRDLVLDFWHEVSSVLLITKKLRYHPVRIIDGGPEGVLDSHGKMRGGQVSSWKFVARIANTPGL